MSADPLRTAPVAYGWGFVSRGYLRAAGHRCGFVEISPTQVRGYAQNLVNTGYAIWATDDMLELTDAGWAAFYDLTGYTADQNSRTIQNGKVRADCALVLFTSATGTAAEQTRTMLVEAKGRDWEAACREDWALHPNGGWVFVRVDPLGHPGRLDPRQTC